MVNRLGRVGLQPVALAVLALLIAVTAIALKFAALHAWRYSSDLFTFDLMLQETLRGHFALEYTYGRETGEHACLILLLLLPVKWLVGKHMVYVLLGIAPAIFLVCGAILYAAVKAMAGMRSARVITLLY